MLLVLNAASHHAAGRSTGCTVARRQREGWQLVSAGVDGEGTEVIVFRRPGLTWL